jgi:hypothetical protein
MGERVSALALIIAVGAAPLARGQEGGAGASAGGSDALVSEGVKLIMEGDIPGGRKILEGVVRNEPKNARALGALGYALLKLNQKLAARDRMDQAAGNAVALTRPTALNRGIAHAVAGAPVKGGQIVADYLVKQSSASAGSAGNLDEQAVDLLGAILAQVPERQRSTPACVQVNKALEEQIRKLEAANPGYRKWGNRWVAQQQYDDYLKSNARLKSDMSTARKQLDESKKEAEDVAGQLRQLEAGPSTPATRRAKWVAESRLEGLKQKVADGEKRLEALAGQEQVPVWDVELEPVALDADQPPPVSFSRESATAREAPTENGGGPTPPPVTRGPAQGEGRGAGGTDAGRSGGADGGDRTVDRTPDPIHSGGGGGGSITGVKAESGQAAAIAVSEHYFVVAGPVTAGCSISILDATGGHMDAEFVRGDAAAGLALVRLKSGKARPMPLAESDPEAGEAEVMAFPGEVIFSPECKMLKGTLTRKTGGDDDFSLSLPEHPRLAGAPVVQGGKVVAIVAPGVQPDRANLRIITAAQVRTFLGEKFPLPAAAGGEKLDPALAPVVVDYRGR